MSALSTSLYLLPSGNLLSDNNNTCYTSDLIGISQMTNSVKTTDLPQRPRVLAWLVPKQYETYASVILFDFPRGVCSSRRESAKHERNLSHGLDPSRPVNNTCICGRPSNCTNCTIPPIMSHNATPTHSVKSIFVLSSEQLTSRPIWYSVIFSDKWSDSVMRFSEVVNGVRPSETPPQNRNCASCP